MKILLSVGKGYQQPAAPIHWRGEERMCMGVYNQYQLLITMPRRAPPLPASPQDHAGYQPVRVPPGECLSFFEHNLLLCKRKPGFPLQASTVVVELKERHRHLWPSLVREDPGGRDRKPLWGWSQQTTCGAHGLASHCLLASMPLQGLPRCLRCGLGHHSHKDGMSHL